MQERHVKKRDNWPNFMKFLMAIVPRKKFLIGSRHLIENRFILLVVRTDFQNFGVMEGH